MRGHECDSYVRVMVARVLCSNFQVPHYTAIWTHFLAWERFRSVGKEQLALLLEPSPAAFSSQLVASSGGMRSESAKET